MSSQNPGSSQGSDKQEREWALKYGTMEVLSVGKKDPQKDEYMTIDLVFTMDDNPIPKSVGEYFADLHYILGPTFLVE